MKSPLEFLQPLGRALMLPIAVLPVAGLLLRIGQPDLANLPFVAAAGDAVFSNLGLLFAIGVAVGFAKENNGTAGLAGVVCFLIATKGGQVLLTVPPSTVKGLTAAGAAFADAAFREAALAKVSVPIGIVSGLVGGIFYNRFSTVKLPEYLAFFGGRRFVSIVAGVAGLGLAAVVGLGYGAIDAGVDGLSHAIVASGAWGLFAYGLLNRLLLVTGLHHIINNIVYFVIGDYHGTTGDLRRFFAGDPTAGAFMSGYFPVMMFGLPAACLAMYRSALPSRRKAVAGMFVSLALTSFLTGVTEPIEFSFMFLAPALYAVHAVFTGAAMVLMNALGVKLGYGFSAGLIDYVLNFGKATRPWLLLPVGAAYFALYYLVFRVAIRWLGLKTPGREDEAPVDEAMVGAAPAAGSRGEAFALALGGAANLEVVDACTTRLRLILVDPALADEPRLRALGARGFVRPSARAFQVVLGPEADLVAGEIRDAVGRAPAPAQVVAAPVAAAPAPPDAHPRAAEWIAALGGKDNLVTLQVCDSRVRVELRDPARLNRKALNARGVVDVGPNTFHILVGPDAPPLGRALEALAR